MKKKTSEEDNTVILSDKYLSESGVQGGKIIGEKLVLFSFMIGIPLLLIGLYVIINMSLGWGLPTNLANILGVLLVIVIGLLMTIGGYFIYKDKHSKK
jgi:hypothetical protein